MKELKERIARIRQAFERLSEREQLIVAGGSIGGAFLILLIIALALSSAVGGAEHRVKVKTEQLLQVLQLQGEYQEKKRVHEARLAELKRTRTRLVSMLESTARQHQIGIGQLRPNDSEPNEEGIYETRVDLRAANIPINKLQDFLNSIKKMAGNANVTRMRVTKPYRKETLDVDMTISSLRAK